MKKEQLDDLIYDLISEYQPNFQCIEAKGECDYRTKWADDKCPCSKLMELKAKLENDELLAQS